MSNDERNPGPLLTTLRAAREAYEAALMSPTRAGLADADLACSEALAALLRSQEEIPWVVSDDGYEFDEVWAASLDAAVEEAKDLDIGDYPDVEATLRIVRRIRSEDIDEDESFTITVDPEEPECEKDKEHVWGSPYHIVGGLKENPGVYGHGGGVIIHEVCLRCGTSKKTDTWAQDRETGEQGLESVSYVENEHEADIAPYVPDMSPADAWEAFTLHDSLKDPFEGLVDEDGDPDKDAVREFLGKRPPAKHLTAENFDLAVDLLCDYIAAEYVGEDEYIAGEDE